VNPRIAKMTTITIDPAYGYVILAAASTFILNTIHGNNTTAFRKLAKVPYPNCYADAETAKAGTAAHKFNCAQRAHANYIENQPSAVAALLIAGLQFPITAAIMGAGWSVSRYIYMVGYSQGGEGGKGRYKGITFWLFQFGLVGLCIYEGVTMAMKSW